MKKLAVIFLALCTAPAFAARPDTTQLSCRDASGLVAANGAIVLAHGPHLFDRYVAHGGFCGTTENAIPAFVPTLDNSLCFVGNVCVSSDSSEGSRIVARASACREGSRQMILESDSSGDNTRQVTYVCRAGKWVNPYAAPEAPRAPASCKEGRRQVIHESEGDSTRSVTYICRNGQMRPEFQ
jgi:hypothetical protein